MYSAQPNGADSATINPAALSSELVNATSRGTKRSRSPDYPDLPHTGTAGDDEHRQKKRGRPMKKPISESPALPNIPQLAQPMQVPSQPPQAQNVPVPTPPQPAFVAPPQASPPPKTTPTKTTLKALPTVRDHTTDQLGPGGDEYLPREIDEAGEKKVMPNGQLLGGREYRCRTFLVPNRGDKLFMLATECARVLSYRDSYLLFNKNRSLFKIIASQEEKDDLVQQDILPFSYRSRQIAIVTARSMFRQFGSRVIQNGRRVRDDYWESKARKQGFTEADLAGEKRPGAAKAREEAAQAANAALLAAPHEIVYSTSTPHFGGPPQPQLIQPDLSDRRADFSNLLKGGPRQEITGPPYHDRTQSAPLAEIQTQAGQAADYNRSVNQQREMRNDYLQNIWRRPHEQPASTAALSQPIGAGESTLPTTRPAPSTSSIPQSGMVPTQSTQIMMTAPPYSQPLHTQATAAPMRGMAPVSTPKSGRPTSLSSGTTGSLPQTSYNYGPSSQMWAPHQTTQTPQHGYSGYTTQAQASPHPPQSTTPQMRHASGAQVQPSMQFSGMPGMNQAYGSSGQNMYPTDQTPRQYMPSSASPAPAVTQGWTNSQTTAQWWTPQQQ